MSESELWAAAARMQSERDRSPYFHTFTPGASELPYWLTCPYSDAEVEARDWWEENDPEASALLYPPSYTVERTEWIGADGFARAIGTEGEPTTVTMFIPLTEETP